MARDRLTQSEAALINAVGAVAARLPVWDAALIDTARIVIADVLPECDRAHPHLQPVCAAAAALLDWPNLSPQMRGLHGTEIRDAAAAVLIWRAAIAHDAVRRRTEAAA